jgi:hypothetical protein
VAEGMVGEAHHSSYIYIYSYSYSYRGAEGRRNEFVEPRGAAPDAAVVVLKAREPTATVDADTAVFSADSGRLASFRQNAEHAPFIHYYYVNLWRDYKRRVRSRRPARGALPPLMHL